VTPEQLALVRTSYATLGPAKADLAPEFYRQLFARDPSLRDLFTQDWPVQEEKFTKQLTEIVNSIADLGDFLGRTRSLGARHAGYGVRASHYDTVGAALISTLATTLGDRFDDATREAWELAYNMIAECMLDGAARN
jgi:hemoglobin-like flavoprotein